MIGFFDSGFGGLTTLQAFEKVLPEYDMLYLGDSARCPYGNLSDDEVRAFTREGVWFLFKQGAKIVILACNTATAHSIRHLQQHCFPDRKILGVTIPGAEKVAEMKLKKIGVLATEASVRIRAYKERVQILDNRISVQEIAARDLVPLIENGEIHSTHIVQLIESYLGKFDPDIEALILWCTHFPLIQEHIKKLRPNLPIIDPGTEAALKFVEYLKRHPEIESKLIKSKARTYFTTGDASRFETIGSFLTNTVIKHVKTASILSPK